MKVVEVAENMGRLVMFPQKVGQASSLSLPTEPNNSRQAGCGGGARGKQQPEVGAWFAKQNGGINNSQYRVL